MQFPPLEIDGASTHAVSPSKIGGGLEGRRYTPGQIDLHSQLYTLNSTLSTLHSQLFTLNSKLSTLNSQLSTLNSQKSARSPKSRTGRFNIAYLFSAALACSASIANAAGSEMASSDSILRLMSMPAIFRPFISLE